MYYKSTAAALLFCVILGPVGLLYASFWGGFFMIFLGIILMNGGNWLPLLIFWLACCIWGVGAVEKHNSKMKEIKK